MIRIRVLVHIAGLVTALAGACARDDSRGAAAPPPSPAATAAPIEDAPTPSSITDAAASLPSADATTDAAPPPDTDPKVDDAVRLIDLDVQAGPLAEQLATAAARAHREERPIAVELWAGWCAPCKKVDRLLAGGELDAALRGAVLVRVDVDAFDAELDALGFTAPQIPSLYRVDARGRPQGKPLSGGDWGRRDAAAIATAVRGLLRPDTSRPDAP